MMDDLIRIEGLQFECIIGVYPNERVTPQPLRLEIELACDTRKAAASGDLRDTVDYGMIAERVETHIKEARFFLLETLAEETVRLIMQLCSTQSVRLTVRKPAAIAHAEAAAITIYRRR